MSESRKAIILKAFNAMDKTGDGVITPADLKKYGCLHRTLHELEKVIDEYSFLIEYIKQESTPNTWMESGRRNDALKSFSNRLKLQIQLMEW